MTFTLKQVIVGGFALSCAVAAAAWAIKIDHISDLSDRLKACEKANTLNYPILLNKITDASSSLEKKLSTMESIENIKEENKALKAISEEKDSVIIELKTESKNEIENIETNSRQSISSLNQQLVNVQNELKNKEKELQEIFSENLEFTLSQGKAKTIANGDVVVGYTGTTYGNKCFITVNNENFEKETGGYVEVKSMERSCKVILENCVDGYNKMATLRFTCN